MNKKNVRVANSILDISPKIKPSRDYRSFGDIGNNLRLDANECTQLPSPKAIKAIFSLLQKGELNQYPEDDAEGMRHKLAAYTSLPAEYIDCFAGSDVAFDFIARTYLEPGTEALINSPADNNVVISAESTGAETIIATHNDPFDHNIENLINLIGPRTRILHIGNPNNFTGTMFSEAEIVFLLAYAENTMIVVDEGYCEFNGRTVADLVKRFSNLIVIRSLSKAFGLASLRSSYILSDPDNIEFINRIKIGRSLSSIARAATIHALDDIDHMTKYVSEINESKRLLSQNLPELGYDFRMTHGNFFLLKVADPPKMVKLLAEDGIFVKDCSEITQLENYVRITIGIKEQTDRLLISLGRISDKMATGMNRMRMTDVVNRVALGIRKSVTVEQNL